MSKRLLRSGLPESVRLQLTMSWGYESKSGDNVVICEWVSLDIILISS